MSDEDIQKTFDNMMETVKAAGDCCNPKATHHVTIFYDELTGIHQGIGNFTSQDDVLRCASVLRQYADQLEHTIKVH